MKKIYFIDSFKNQCFGSSIIRSKQLYDIFIKFNKNSHIESHLSTDKNVKNSVLIFNKYALEELTEEEFEELRKLGNVLIADPLDGVIPDAVLSKFDVIFASSILQQKTYAARFFNRVSYVGHHVDLRIKAVTPEIPHMNIGYFGELSNARYKHELSALVDFIAVDTSSGNDTQWMSSLEKYNAHYAIRSSQLPNQFKPFTKGFIAAHVDSPVLLDSADLEGRHFLGDDYPYFVNSDSATEVRDAIKNMRDDFGGKRWKNALGAMRELREHSSVKVIASQLFEALKPEMITAS